ncbi:MAG: alpha/beta hydrolase [Thermoleophilaceae bacterium]
MTEHEIAYRGDDGCELFALAVGTGPPLVLLHGGGPDCRSLLPLATMLGDRATVLLPDIRGYGRSVCRDRERHTWQQYADDIASLLDHLGHEQALVGGAGMGSGIAMRTGLSSPARVSGLVLISPEHRGEQRPSPKLIAMQQQMADQILVDGLDVAWSSWIPMMPEGMAAMVRDALPRADPASQAAALHAIATQEPIERLDELRALEMPVLVVPGTDPNHPRALGELYRGVLRQPLVIEVDMWKEVADTEDFAAGLAPAISQFLDEIGVGPAAPAA